MGVHGRYAERSWPASDLDTEAYRFTHAYQYDNTHPNKDGDSLGDTDSHRDTHPDFYAGANQDANADRHSLIDTYSRSRWLCDCH